MAIPAAPPWSIANFDSTTLGGLLGLGPVDLTISPATSPYFSYNSDFTILTADSRNGANASLAFHVPIPPNFTIEFTARFPAMPHNLGDLAHRRVGITLADSGGRGISIYFATSGVAVGRTDDFGSVSALPDTTETTEEVRTAFRTIRIAVDGALGRAYVFISDNESSAGLDLRYVIPVFPSSVGDTFTVFATGLPGEPSTVQFKTLRVAPTLLIPNYPPVANAGPDRISPIGQSVRFDGRASFAVSGVALTYLWRAIDAPYGSSFAAENSSGTTVDDGDTDGFTPTLSFTAGSLPAWVGVGDVLLIAGSRHIIATANVPGGFLTVTTDTIPDNLSSSPFRIIRQSVLIGADTETPYALGDIQGVYRFELIVNDGLSDSESAEVLGNFVGARAPFGIEPDVSPIWQALGDEWRYIEGKEVFEETWRGAAQILAGKMLEAWQYHYNFSIRDAQRTFQRKWQPYRSLITETDPDGAVVSPRYGVLQSTHTFEVAAPVVVGLTLVIEYFTGATPTETIGITVTLTGNTLAQIIADVDLAMLGTGISGYSFAHRQEDAVYRFNGVGGSTVPLSGNGFTNVFSFPPASLPAYVVPGDTLLVGNVRVEIATVNNPGGSLTIVSADLADNLAGVSFRIWRKCRLGIRGQRAFRLLVTSTAAVPLGFPTGVYNYLAAGNGALATDRTYFVGDGVDLSDHGVIRNDLLVLNNGQSFRIDRVITDRLDPLDSQRVLLFDLLPADATETWEIPSIVRSSEVDYEFQGSYPGDLVKAEVYDSTKDNITDVLGRVVAQKGTQVAARLDGFFPAFQNPTRYELRLLGVKRRKAIPIDETVKSIPQLQEIIPVAMGPTFLKENIDYVIEPFYRDIGGAKIPMLQFRDSVFLEPDLEPPDVFWAELTIYTNEGNIEDLFGRLVSFMKDDASLLPADFNYTAGVAGLMYARERGPNVAALRVGAQILFGQPFAEVAGVIEEIRYDYSPTKGRVLIRDQDGNTPTKSEIVRSYYYKKDPLDLSLESGLDINPDTGSPWTKGDLIAQFMPIGAGVNIIDLYNTPKWYYPFVRGGLITELEKFHYFLVRFNLDLVTLSDLTLLYQFVLKVKPTYSHPLLVGLRQIIDEVDIVDELTGTLKMNLFDSICGTGRSYMYDDYRGDGTLWTHFDGIGPPWAPVADPDGIAHFDGLVDCPEDIIEFCMTIVWPGGIITFDSIFVLDTLVVDVSGTMGPPGGTFIATYDMLLPAGIYTVCLLIKSGGVIV